MKAEKFLQHALGDEVIEDESMRTIIRDTFPTLQDFVVNEVEQYVKEHERINSGAENLPVAIDKLVSRSKFNLEVVPFIQSRKQAAITIRCVPSP